MKVLVVYASMYGNTEQIAKAVGLKLQATIKNVNELTNEDLEGVELLVVGSPTHGGMAKPDMQTWLSKVRVEGMNVVVFDTRMEFKTQGWFLKLVMKMVDYAAPKMGKLLVSKGANLIFPPEGFIVESKEGPLGKSELERANLWAEKILAIN